jgi:RNA polymerase-binding transcription factor DksA
MERSADPIDNASAETDLADEQAVLRRRHAEALRIRRTAIALADGDFNGINCVECYDELPAVRIADHRMLCTPCASAQEKKDKLKGIR